MNKCSFCVNTPKQANYMVDDRPICKSCINSTFLQGIYDWKARNSKIQYIHGKQVNRYNLPLDQRYRILNFTYTGSILDSGGSVCDNCNRIIVNIATVETQEGKKYDVGLDCAETLSLVDNNDFWKVKEQEALHRKISKWVRDIKIRIDSGKNVNTEKWDSGYAIRFNSMIAYRVSDKVYEQYFKNVLQA